MVEAAVQNIVSAEELRALLEQEADPALSFYMPTQRVAVEADENALHLKNLLARAQGLLESRGVRKPEISEILEPLHRLLDDGTFWHHQLEGLAIFRTSETMRHFSLPFSVPDEVFVDGHFRVKSLFGVLYPPAHFYVLAISHNAVRLLRCDRYEPSAVDLEPLRVPTSLEQALRYDDLQKPELQHHPTTAPGRAFEGQSDTPQRSGTRQHGFHGHGESGEGEKTQLRRYFQEVDSGLQRLLARESAPLVIASVDYLQPLWREATSYHNVLAEGIDGNPDRERDEELHQAALPIVERELRAVIERAREDYGEKQARGLASCELDVVVDAADAGRVDTVFMRRDAAAWGTFDPMSRRVEVHDELAPESEDLVETAVRSTFLNAGVPYTLDDEDMPCEGPIAAIFRY